jgi:hypothetical protein
VQVGAIGGGRRSWAPTHAAEGQRESQRDAELRRQYAISAEEYERIFAYQGGGCAICRRPPGKTRLAVDHDHKTGLTRGLLCWHCNRALGGFHDDSRKLQIAAVYVLHPPATAALGEPRFGRVGRVTNKRKPARKRRTHSGKR